MSPVKLLFLPVLTLLVAYLLYFVQRGKSGRLNYPKILIGFSIKVLLGCLYGYVFLTYYQGDDTWVLFNNSLEQTALLRSDPGNFIGEFGPWSALEHSSGQVHFLSIYTHDLEYYLQVKSLAVLNLITGSDYYLNLVLLNGLFFFGPLGLYQIISRRYRTDSIWLFIACFCFLPPVFWLSGIRSEGYIFLFTVLLIRSVGRLIDQTRLPDLAGAILSLMAVVVFRPPFAFILIPALAVWILIEKGHRRPALAIAGVYGICLLVFFGSSALSADGGLAGKVAGKQRAFFELKGNTRFSLDTLEPSIGSFLATSPQAITNTLFRPYPWEAKGALQWFTVLENLLFLILVTLLAMRIFRRKQGWQSDGFIWAVVAIFLSTYLFIGLTVPFPGAIVRYKCIPELLLLVTLTGINVRQTS